MRLSLSIGLALLMLTAHCVNSVSTVINPSGIQSGLIEVTPLSADSRFIVTWSDPGITNNPYLGIALVQASSAPRTYYKVMPTLTQQTPTQAIFDVSLAGGWVKLVYRWIVSNGEPLFTTIITLGDVTTGTLNIALPLGSPTTFPFTSIQKIDTLLAGFDYINPGTSTGIDIKINPVVPTIDATYNDYVTPVSSATNQPQAPVTITSGQITIPISFAIPTGASLKGIVFTVVFHTVAQSATMTPDIITGYAIPTFTQTGIASIINNPRNILSVVTPEAIYGANELRFPANSQGIDFSFELPQAQTASASFAVPVTKASLGIYMYTLRYPCGTRTDRTADLQLTTAGSWTASPSGNSNFNTIQSTAERSLYLEAAVGSANGVDLHLESGFSFVVGHTYTFTFDLSVPDISSQNPPTLQLIIGANTVVFTNTAVLPVRPATQSFTVLITPTSVANTFKFSLASPTGTQPAKIFISNMNIFDSGGMLSTTTVAGVSTVTCANTVCNPYMNPLSPTNPMLPLNCRDCAPNPTTNSNGCNCPSGYYPKTVGSTFTCELCQASFCQTCLAATPTICSTCVSNRILGSGGTCNCPAGTNPSPLGPCITCLAQCATCDSTVSCLTCKVVDGTTPTNRVTTPAQGLCPCNEGFFDNGVAVCATCSPQCRTCSGTALTCTSCKLNSNTWLDGSACRCLSGFAPSPTTPGTCVPCHYTCLTCSGLTQAECTGCSSTRQLVEINPGVGTCNCKSNFNPVAGQPDCVVGNCAALYRGCVNCNATVCLLCSTALNYNPTPSSQGCECKAGFAYSLSADRCVSCGTACQNCSSLTTCGQCYGNATQTGTTCSCPIGTYADATSLTCVGCSMVGCSVCEANTCTACRLPWNYTAGTCICPDQTFPSGGQCLNCSTGCRLCQSSTVCTSCLSNYFLLNGVCNTTCPDTFVGINRECINCPTNCRVCSSAMICTNCSSGFFLSAGSCLNSCPNTAFTNTTSMTCQPCISPCKTCSSSTTYCGSCLPDLGFLLQGTCIPRCPAMTTEVNGVCLVCDSSCASCFGSQTTCSSCPSPKYLHNGLCVDSCPDGTYYFGRECLSVCPTGKYPSGNGCANCNRTCSACASANGCTQCIAGLYLWNGYCSSCPPSTTPYMGPNGGVCLTCPVNCAQCSSPTVCTLCASAQYQLVAGNCVVCLGSTVVDLLNGNCIQCPANCVACSNSTYCTQCNSLTVLVGGQCYTCLSPCATCDGGPTVCATCINGYALSGTACVRECIDPNQVIVNARCQCRNGYYHNGACISTCPPGTGPSTGRICVPCSSNCNKCSVSASICEQCRVGYSLDPLTRSVCIPDANCAYGQASSNGVCVRLCLPGFYYSEGYCYTDCPSGTLINGANSGCGVQTTTPVCRIGRVLYKGVCIDECPLGTYQRDGVCYDCSIGCNSCANASFCLDCATGYYFSSGSCILNTICNEPLKSLGSSCVLSCPFGTFATAGFCDRVCGQNLVFYNGWCWRNCPTGLVSNGYGCIDRCPPGQTVVNGVCTGGSSNGCQNGYFASGSTCLPCQAPCATCIGQATICTSCTVGVPVNWQCRGNSTNGTALIVTVNGVALSNNQMEIVLGLNVPLPNLPLNLVSQFFTVELPPFVGGDRVSVYQWATNNGEVIHVVLQFSTVPSSSTKVTLKVNTAAVGTSYAAIGVTDFSRANAEVLVSSARSTNVAAVPAGTGATFAVRGREQQAG